MIGEIAHYLAAILLLAGAFFGLVAAVGVLRLPDLYTRMHAASMAGAVGCGMVLLAVALVSTDGAVTVRALIGIGFLLLTSPVSAHLLARAHYLSGGRSTDITVSNELDIVNKAARDS